ncbi:GroES-like protein [Hypoxylon argillaceum]|nr:GroES-like protein [Hypoxylon argillaceum]
MDSLDSVKKPPQQLPESHCVVVQDSHGQPTIQRDATLPPMLPGTVLAKTKAVALNPSDFKMGIKFPTPGAVIGTDFAGEIVQMHGSVRELRPDLKIGDMVYGLVHGSNPGDPGNGAFAEYVRVPALLAIKYLGDLDISQACSLGVAAATSWMALWEHLCLPASPSQPAPESFDVLVYGGSTCCGAMAIQLLKLSGARVVTTCSPKNFNLVKSSYGVDAVFDYTNPDTPKVIRQYTNNRLCYALDCIADADSVSCCYAAMGRAGGKYVSLEYCPKELQTRNAIKSEFVMVLEMFGERVQLGGEYGREPNRERFNSAARWSRQFEALLDEGVIRPHPIECLSGGFEGVIEGLQRLKTGSISGKKLVVELP